MGKVIGVQFGAHSDRFLLVDNSVNCCVPIPAVCYDDSGYSIYFCDYRWRPCHEMDLLAIYSLVPPKGNGGLRYESVMFDGYSFLTK